jgi:hypothetical protein
VTAFYCTGRGTHGRIPVTAVTSQASQARSLTVVVQCPACGIGPKTLGWGVRQRLADAGLAEVDISALPF